MQRETEMFPYHRPVPIFVDSLKYHREGIGRDPIRLLLRAAAHLDLINADLFALFDLMQYRDDYQKELLANCKAAGELFTLALDLRMEKEHGKTNSAGVRETNPERPGPGL